jgi:hypothetical protein
MLDSGLRASADSKSDSNSGVKLDRDQWLEENALSEADKALIEQRFRDLEAKPHASVPWGKAKLRLRAPAREVFSAVAAIRVQCSVKASGGNPRSRCFWEAVAFCDRFLQRHRRRPFQLCLNRAGDSLLWPPLKALPRPHPNPLSD